MIMSIKELRKFITTDETDAMLQIKLDAIEQLVRNYTHNNFQHRGFRCIADIKDGILVSTALQPFSVGDTVQVTESQLNAGLYTVTAVTESTFEIAGQPLHNESGVCVTKVYYPADIKVGTINLIKWELNNRDKVGIQSETISRHSVTYFNLDGDNTSVGYPKSLTGFLTPYKKARF